MELGFEAAIFPDPTDQRNPNIPQDGLSGEVDADEG